MTPAPALCIRLPIRTVSTLNAREHWAKRARRASAERSAAFLVTPRGVALPCTVTLTRAAPRRLDGDNWQGAAKSIRDGIAQRLGVDDADPRVSWRYDQVQARGYAVEILIQPGRREARRCHV